LKIIWIFFNPFLAVISFFEDARKAGEALRNF